MIVCFGVVGCLSLHRTNTWWICCWIDSIRIWRWVDSLLLRNASLGNMDFWWSWLTKNYVRTALAVDWISKLFSVIWLSNTSRSFDIEADDFWSSNIFLTRRIIIVVIWNSTKKRTLLFISFVWMNNVFFLHIREGHSNKAYFRQKQNDIGIARRYSDNVEGWSGYGNFLSWAWCICITLRGR